MEGSFGPGNEISVSLKFWEFILWLFNCRLSKRLRFMWLQLRDDVRRVGSVTIPHLCS
jgi:hypothetical protein